MICLLNHLGIVSYSVVIVVMAPQGGAILLLTGPSGCGKTATVRVLAKDLGFQIQEWSNPSTTTQYKTENLFTQSFDPGQESSSLIVAARD